MQNEKPKIIVIEGPTATGKSDLAVFVAQKIEGLTAMPAHAGQAGEVISADSRQVYKGMDLGTGKITKKEQGGIPHHLLDVMSPKKIFTVVDWKKQTEKAIEKILKKGGVPIICGGTGFYIQSIVDDVDVPDVPPNKKLRASLRKKTTDELFEMLKKLDTTRAGNIDPKNPVRLIRAIEIADAIGHVPEFKRNAPKYKILQIGLILNKEGLAEKIHTRLIKRIKAGMIREVRGLQKKGVSWKHLYDFGLEYRCIGQFLQKKMSKNEMLAKLTTEINRYAKRQIAWFKRDKKIKWFNPKERAKILSTVKKFLKP